jgi:hypothetical protein
VSIYLCLLKILLSSVASCKAVPISVYGETKTLSSPSSTSSTSNPPLPLESNDNDTEKHKSNENKKLQSNLNIKNFKLSDVIEVAERCHDKIDTIAFLSILPKNIPLFQIEKYLRLVLEFGNHKKRNLMVRMLVRTHLRIFSLKIFFMMVRVLNSVSYYVFSSSLLSSVLYYLLLSPFCSLISPLSPLLFPHFFSYLITYRYFISCSA